MRKVRQGFWNGERRVYVDEVLDRHPELGIEMWYDRRGSACYKTPNAPRLFHSDMVLLTHNILRAEEVGLQQEELALYVLNVSGLDRHEQHATLAARHLEQHGSNPLTQSLPIAAFKELLGTSEFRRVVHDDTTGGLITDLYHTEQFRRLEDATARYILRDDRVGAAVVFAKERPAMEIVKSVCYPVASYYEADWPGRFGTTSAAVRRIYVEETMMKKREKGK